MSASREQPDDPSRPKKHEEKVYYLPRLLEQAKPRTPQEKESMRHSLEALLKAWEKEWGEKHPERVIPADAERQVNALIAGLDQKISDQLNEVLHDPKFQKLEATWRGLKYLVDSTNSGPLLKVMVLNVTPDELAKDFEHAGSVERSDFYHKVVEAKYGAAGGKPFGMLVSDYEFTHRPADMFLLQEMSKVAAAGHAPFVAAASPEMFGLDSYDELQGPDKVGGVFEGADYAKWRSFRESEDARYVALTLPRVLARLPYGENTKKVDAFAFEEAVDGRDHSKYLWMSAAWAYAARVTDAFDKDGWLARTQGVEGGGKVADLPTHTFDTDLGGRVMKCPTEIALPLWREHEMSGLGFLPLIHWQDSDYAAFIGTQTCQKPNEYRGPLGAEATANAAVSAKLNHILCVSRFSHYLKAMLVNWLGLRMSREELESKLNTWINSYVVEDPSKLREADRYKYPLKQAKIEVSEVPGQPGWYQTVAHMRPHLHLEGVTISMRLVAKMPDKK